METYINKEFVDANLSFIATLSCYAGKFLKVKVKRLFDENKVDSGFDYWEETGRVQKVDNYLEVEGNPLCLFLETRTALYAMRVDRIVEADDEIPADNPVVLAFSALSPPAQ